MRKIVYFIRHAEAGVNTNPLIKEGGDALTERGLYESQAIAERLVEVPFSHIYTSKIPRALFTAQKIGDRTGKVPLIEEAFKERKVLYTNVREYVFQESFDDFLKRVFEAKFFLEQIPDEGVVVVSHALFIRAFLVCISFSEVTEDTLTHVDKTFLVRNGSLTKFEYDSDKKRWRVVFWNDVSHLS